MKGSGAKRYFPRTLFVFMQMKQKNKPSAMEYLWIFVAAISFLLALHSTYKNGFAESKVLFVFTFIGVLMYLWRRNYRLKNEK